MGSRTAVEALLLNTGGSKKILEIGGCKKDWIILFLSTENFRISSLNSSTFKMQLGFYQLHHLYTYGGVKKVISIQPNRSWFFADPTSLMLPGAAWGCASTLQRVDAALLCHILTEGFNAVIYWYYMNQVGLWFHWLYWIWTVYQYIDLYIRTCTWLSIWSIIICTNTLNLWFSGLGIVHIRLHFIWQSGNCC